MRSGTAALGAGLPAILWLAHLVGYAIRVRLSMVPLQIDLVCQDWVPITAQSIIAHQRARPKRTRIEANHSRGKEVQPNATWDIMRQGVFHCRNPEVGNAAAMACAHCYRNQAAVMVAPRPSHAGWALVSHGKMQPMVPACCPADVPVHIGSELPPPWPVPTARMPIIFINAALGACARQTEPRS
jgi:hypothetical protein